MGWNIQLHKSKGYALFLALLPMIMMYRVPVIGLGVSTTLIAIGMIYAFAVIARMHKFIQWKVVSPFLIYLLYVMTKSTLVYTLIYIAIGFHIIALSTGALDVKALKRYVEKIAMLAAIGTIVQMMIHIILGVHLPMIISSLCLSDLDYYSKAIATGVSRHSTMYRPSAFFLEPAHLTMYCIVALNTYLFQEKPDYKKAIIVSAGILTTTSGMGIVLTAITWVIFPLLYGNGVDFTKIKRIVGMTLFLFASFAILHRTPFFQSSLARIAGPVEYSSTQYNAIWGRTANWKVYIDPLSGNELRFGKGISAIPAGVYFTGLMTIVYSYGIVGTVLLYASLLWLIFRCKNMPYKLVTVIYGVMLSMADLAGLINIMFYVGSAVAIIACQPKKKCSSE